MTVAALISALIIHLSMMVKPTAIVARLVKGYHLEVFNLLFLFVFVCFLVFSGPTLKAPVFFKFLSTMVPRLGVVA